MNRARGRWRKNTARKSFRGGKNQPVNNYIENFNHTEIAAEEHGHYNQPPPDYYTQNNDYYNSNNEYDDLQSQFFLRMVKEGSLNPTQKTDPYNRNFPGSSHHSDYRCTGPVLSKYNKYDSDRSDVEFSDRSDEFERKERRAEDRRNDSYRHLDTSSRYQSPRSSRTIYEYGHRHRSPERSSSYRRSDRRYSSRERYERTLRRSRSRSMDRRSWSRGRRSRSRDRRSRSRDRRSYSRERDGKQSKQKHTGRSDSERYQRRHDNSRYERKRGVRQGSADSKENYPDRSHDKSSSISDGQKRSETGVHQTVIENKRNADGLNACFNNSSEVPEVKRKSETNVQQGSVGSKSCGPDRSVAKGFLDVSVTEQKSESENVIQHNRDNAGNSSSEETVYEVVDMVISPETPGKPGSTIFVDTPSRKSLFGKERESKDSHSELETGNNRDMQQTIPKKNIEQIKRRKVEEPSIGSCLKDKDGESHSAASVSQKRYGESSSCVCKEMDGKKVSHSPITTTISKSGPDCAQDSSESSAQSPKSDQIVDIGPNKVKQKVKVTAEVSSSSVQSPSSSAKSQVNDKTCHSLSCATNTLYTGVPNHSLATARTSDVLQDTCSPVTSSEPATSSVTEGSSGSSHVLNTEEPATSSTTSSSPSATESVRTNIFESLFQTLPLKSPEKSAYVLKVSARSTKSPKRNFSFGCQRKSAIGNFKKSSLKKSALFKAKLASNSPKGPKSSTLLKSKQSDENSSPTKGLMSPVEESKKECVYSVAKDTEKEAISELPEITDSVAKPNLSESCSTIVSGVSKNIDSKKCDMKEKTGALGTSEHDKVSPNGNFLMVKSVVHKTDVTVDSCITQKSETDSLGKECEKLKIKPVVCEVNKNSVNVEEVKDSEKGSRRKDVATGKESKLQNDQQMSDKSEGVKKSITFGHSPSSSKKSSIQISLVNDGGQPKQSATDTEVCGKLTEEQKQSNVELIKQLSAKVDQYESPEKSDKCSPTVSPSSLTITVTKDSQEKTVAMRTLSFEEHSTEIKSTRSDQQRKPLCKKKKDNVSSKLKETSKAKWKNITKETASRKNTQEKTFPKRRHPTDSSEADVPKKQKCGNNGASSDQKNNTPLVDSSLKLQSFSEKVVQRGNIAEQNKHTITNKESVPNENLSLLTKPYVCRINTLSDVTSKSAGNEMNSSGTGKDTTETVEGPKKKDVLKDSCEAFDHTYCKPADGTSKITAEVTSVDGNKDIIPVVKKTCDPVHERVVSDVEGKHEACKTNVSQLFETHHNKTNVLKTERKQDILEGSSGCIANGNLTSEPIWSSQSETDTGRKYLTVDASRLQTEAELIMKNNGVQDKNTASLEDLERPLLLDIQAKSKQSTSSESPDSSENIVHTNFELEEKSKELSSPSSLPDASYATANSRACPWLQFSSRLTGNCSVSEEKQVDVQTLKSHVDMCDKFPVEKEKSSTLDIPRKVTYDIATSEKTTELPYNEDNSPDVVKHVDKAIAAVNRISNKKKSAAETKAESVKELRVLHTEVKLLSLSVKKPSGEKPSCTSTSTETSSATTDKKSMDKSVDDESPDDSKIDADVIGKAIAECLDIVVDSELLHSCDKPESPQPKIETCQLQDGEKTICETDASADVLLLSVSPGIRKIILEELKKRIVAASPDHKKDIEKAFRDTSSLCHSIEPVLRFVPNEQKAEYRETVKEAVLHFSSKRKASKPDLSSKARKSSKPHTDKETRKDQTSVRQVIGKELQFEGEKKTTEGQESEKGISKSEQSHEGEASGSTRYPSKPSNDGTKYPSVSSSDCTGYPSMSSDDGTRYLSVSSSDTTGDSSRLMIDLTDLEQLNTGILANSTPVRPKDQADHCAPENQFDRHLKGNTVSDTVGLTEEKFQTYDKEHSLKMNDISDMSQDKQAMSKGEFKNKDKCMTDNVGSEGEKTGFHMEDCEQSPVEVTYGENSDLQQPLQCQARDMLNTSQETIKYGQDSSQETIRYGSADDNLSFKDEDNIVDEQMQKISSDCNRHTKHGQEKNEKKVVDDHNQNSGHLRKENKSSCGVNTKEPDIDIQVNKDKVDENMIGQERSWLDRKGLEERDQETVISTDEQEHQRKSKKEVVDTQEKLKKTETSFVGDNLLHMRTCREAVIDKSDHEAYNIVEDGSNKIVGGSPSCIVLQNDKHETEDLVNIDSRNKSPSNELDIKISNIVSLADRVSLECGNGIATVPTETGQVGQQTSSFIDGSNEVTGEVGQLKSLFMDGRSKDIEKGAQQKSSFMDGRSKAIEEVGQQKFSFLDGRSKDIGKGAQQKSSFMDGRSENIEKSAQQKSSFMDGRSEAIEEVGQQKSCLMDGNSEVIEDESHVRESEIKETGIIPVFVNDDERIKNVVGSNNSKENRCSSLGKDILDEETSKIAEAFVTSANEEKEQSKIKETAAASRIDDTLFHSNEREMENDSVTLQSVAAVALSEFSDEKIQSENATNSVIETYDRNQHEHETVCETEGNEGTDVELSSFDEDDDDIMLIDLNVFTPAPPSYNPMTPSTPYSLHRSVTPAPHTPSSNFTPYSTEPVSQEAAEDCIAPGQSEQLSVETSSTNNQNYLERENEAEVEKTVAGNQPIIVGSVEASEKLNAPEVTATNTVSESVPTQLESVQTIQGHVGRFMSRQQSCVYEPELSDITDDEGAEGSLSKNIPGTELDLADSCNMHVPDLQDHMLHGETSDSPLNLSVTLPPTYPETAQTESPQSIDAQSDLNALSAKNQIRNTTIQNLGQSCLTASDTYRSQAYKLKRIERTKKLEEAYKTIVSQEAAEGDSGGKKLQTKPAGSKSPKKISVEESKKHESPVKKQTPKKSPKKVADSTNSALNHKAPTKSNTPSKSKVAKSKGVTSSESHMSEFVALGTKGKKQPICWKMDLLRRHRNRSGSSTDTQESGSFSTTKQMSSSVELNKEKMNSKDVFLKLKENLPLLATKSKEKKVLEKESEQKGKDDEDSNSSKENSDYLDNEILNAVESIYDSDSEVDRNRKSSAEEKKRRDSLENKNLDICKPPSEEKRKKGYTSPSVKKSKHKRQLSLEEETNMWRMRLQQCEDEGDQNVCKDYSCPSVSDSIYNSVICDSIDILHSVKPIQSVKNIEDENGEEEILESGIHATGVDICHTLILTSGRELCTIGKIHPQRMDFTSRRFISCQVCQKFFSPLNFATHHDNPDIEKLVHRKKSIQKLAQSKPLQDNLFWSEDGEKIWDKYLAASKAELADWQNAKAASCVSPRESTSQTNPRGDVTKNTADKCDVQKGEGDGSGKTMSAEDDKEKSETVSTTDLHDGVSVSSAPTSTRTADGMVQCNGCSRFVANTVCEELHSVHSTEEAAPCPEVVGPSDTGRPSSVRVSAGVGVSDCVQLSNTVESSATLNKNFQISAITTAMSSAVLSSLSSASSVACSSTSLSSVSSVGNKSIKSAALSVNTSDSVDLRNNLTHQGAPSISPTQRHFVRILPGVAPMSPPVVSGSPAGIVLSPVTLPQNQAGQTLLQPCTLNIPNGPNLRPNMVPQNMASIYSVANPRQTILANLATPTATHAAPLYYYGVNNNPSIAPMNLCKGRKRRHSMESPMREPYILSIVNNNVSVLPVGKQTVSGQIGVTASLPDRARHTANTLERTGSLSSYGQVTSQGNFHSNSSPMLTHLEHTVSHTKSTAPPSSSVIDKSSSVSERTKPCYSTSSANSPCDGNGVPSQGPRDQSQNVCISGQKRADMLHVGDFIVQQDVHQAESTRSSHGTVNDDSSVRSGIQMRTTEHRQPEPQRPSTSRSEPDADGSEKVQLFTQLKDAMFGPGDCDPLTLFLISDKLKDYSIKLLLKEMQERTEEVDKLKAEVKEEKRRGKEVEKRLSSTENCLEELAGKVRKHLKKS